MKYVKSILPEYKTPLPVRSTAKIQRVWISPYETEDSVLHMGGKSFQEIEERKWSVGIPNVELRDYSHFLQLKRRKNKHITV